MNNWLVTPNVRVVGTWDGFNLSLISPLAASTASAPSAVPALDCATNAVPTAAVTAARQRVAVDWPGLDARGAYLMMFRPCEKVLKMLIAVPYPATVEYLKSTYAPVEVHGWFQPV